MGRRALPASVHALRGNPGKRKRKPDTAGMPPGEYQTIDNSVVEVRIPPAPEELSATAKRHWTYLAPILFARGLLRDTDLNSLETLCRLEAHDAELAALIEKEGAYYEVNGIKRRHPAVTDRQKLTKDLRDYRDRFGLSPQARVRVPAAIGGGGQTKMPLNQPDQPNPRKDGQEPSGEAPGGKPVGDALDAHLSYRPGLPN